MTMVRTKPCAGFDYLFSGGNFIVIVVRPQHVTCSMTVGPTKLGSSKKTMADDCARE